MMLAFALYFFLIHLFPTTTLAAAAASTTAPAYTATDFILLNCGSSSNLNDSSNRIWESDDLSYASTISSASTASTMHPSVDQVPYATARFFRSPSTYTFQVLKGPKFLRLYFYPAVYSHFNTSQSLFSVTVNALALLCNFSAFLNSLSHTSQPPIKKEFIINIDENHQRLDLTFFPNPNSFAFINGIEIVPVPDKLYLLGDDVPIKFLNQSFFYLNNFKATLEDLYRLNVGGSSVEIQDDSMFRAWSPDDEYIYSVDFGRTTPHAENLQIKYTTQTPPYSAPAIVYTTSRATTNYSKSLEWRFAVDSGFYYLLRLHFCEFQLGVTERNQRVFTISINNQTAETEADIISWTGGSGIPIFKDYITLVPDDGRHGKQHLQLSLIPNLAANPEYPSAVLNGLEIFKLNNSNWSVTVAAADPAIAKKKSRGSRVIYAVIGSAISIFAVIAAVSYLISRRQKVKNSALFTSAEKPLWVLLSAAPKFTTIGTSGSLPSNFCRYFSLDEIKSATRGFDGSYVIGRGGFGNVYKGLIDGGANTVAIKRLNKLSNQGAREFLTEIEMLSKLRHLHLVSLVGYCNEGGEMILVYDYMAHGTLHDHLHNLEKSALTWKESLQICVGAAKGLHYLHTGTKQTVIHRDVKSTNILLDEKWVAKISDFGLSEMGPANESFTHISTDVKGTFGYLDPEYFVTSKLTRKSDVYAFGVVLFEVVARRPAVDISLEEEQHSLAGWARKCIQEGEVDQLIDHNLMGQISLACLQVFVEIAGRCLCTQPQGRPEMADVVKGLELASALQQTTDPMEQVEEGENAAERMYRDQSNGLISVDDKTPPKGESDRIISDNNPCSSTQNKERMLM